MSVLILGTILVLAVLVAPVLVFGTIAKGFFRSLGKWRAFVWGSFAGWVLFAAVAVTQFYLGPLGLALITFTFIGPVGIAASAALVYAFAKALAKDFPPEPEVMPPGAPRYFLVPLGIAVALSLALIALPLISQALPAPAHVASANEETQALGPVPAFLQDAYRSREADARHYSANLLFNRSGTIVGYVEAAGTGTRSYFIEQRTVVGPIVGQVGYAYTEQSLPEERWLRKNNWWATEKPLRCDEARAGHSLSCRTWGTLTQSSSDAIGRVRVLYDGKEVASYPTRTATVPGGVLSDDGLHYAYVVGTEGAFYVVVDGRPTKRYPVVDNLHFEEVAVVFNSVSEDFSQFLRVSVPI